MKNHTLDQIRNKLEAPIAALDKIANGRSLPKIFIEVSIMELREAQELLDFLKEKPLRGKKR